MPQAKVAWWILMGTIPAALMGMLWEEQFEALFHSPLRVNSSLPVVSGASQIPMHVSSAGIDGFCLLYVAKPVWIT